MARVLGRTKAYRERLVRMLARGPQRPSELGWRSWLSVVKRTVVEFVDDDLSDRAASVTTPCGKKTSGSRQKTRALWQAWSEPKP